MWFVTLEDSVLHSHAVAVRSSLGGQRSISLKRQTAGRREGVAEEEEEEEEEGCLLTDVCVFHSTEKPHVRCWGKAFWEM